MAGPRAQSRWLLELVVASAPSQTRPRRLLAIGHTYGVASYRRLPHEIALAANGTWDVTVAAPLYYRGSQRFGDLRPVRLEALPGERSELVGLPMHLTQRVHVALFGRGLRRLLQRPWDVIHLWQEPFVFAGAQIAMLTPKSTSLVFSSFQNIDKRYPPPFNWIERFVVRSAAGWVAPAATVEQTLIGRPGYALRAHRRIAFGVDTDAFRPDSQTRSAAMRELSWAPDGPPVVGFLGRLTEAKGLPLLLRTLDRVDSPWRALFIGTGPEERRLRAWAAPFGDRVRILTAVGHDRVPHFLNAMDVMCAPSQTTGRWREQFGRMLIEAFACGVPVIGSSSGEIPHVLADAGLIVDEHDDAGWATTLDRLLRDPAVRERLAQRGRRRAETAFAWPVIAREYVQFFDELRARRPAS